MIPKKEQSLLQSLLSLQQWLNEHSFSLDKSVDYDIKFEPVVKD